MIGIDANGRAGINSKEKVDFTNINKIVFDTCLYNNYGTGLTGTVYCGIYTKKTNDFNFTKYISYSTNAVQAKPESKKIEVDVTDIIGEYYIKLISLHPSNVSAYGFFTDIYSINMLYKN